MLGQGAHNLPVTELRATFCNSHVNLPFCRAQAHIFALLVGPRGTKQAAAAVPNKAICTLQNNFKLFIDDNRTHHHGEDVTHSWLRRACILGDGTAVPRQTAGACASGSSFEARAPPPLPGSSSGWSPPESCLLGENAIAVKMPRVDQYVIQGMHSIYHILGKPHLYCSPRPLLIPSTEKFQ